MIVYKLIKKLIKKLFGERFAEVNTDNLEQGDVMPADVVNKVNDFYLWLY
jgi:hypothetical protein